MILIKLKSWLPIIVVLGFYNCDLENELDDAFIDISGIVTNNGEPVINALVLLVASTDVSDGLSLSNGSITGSNGNYSIINVENGEYYIVAIEDNNSNLEFDIESDRIGFYGIDLIDLDIEPDKIIVSNEDIDQINITYLTSL
tara:strand:- start:583 stop:1011 length:429 start_codon:yes stop_codon:yes gene_type:complete